MHRVLDLNLHAASMLVGGTQLHPGNTLACMRHQTRVQRALHGLQAARNIIAEQILPSAESSQVGQRSREAAQQLSTLDPDTFPLGFATGGSSPLNGWLADNVQACASLPQHLDCLASLGILLYLKCCGSGLLTSLSCQRARAQSSECILS